MKAHLLNILTLLTLTFLTTFGQEADMYADKIVTILKTQTLSKKLSYSLDSLKSKHMPSRSNFHSYFDRDLDFGYRHQRINLELNFYNYQIDILKKNDTVCVLTLKQYIHPFGIESKSKYFYNWNDTTQSLTFLKLRNKLYKSKKTFSNLVLEISKSEEFALYCGDGSPITKMGQKITKLVEEENYSELTDMLKSFCVETQSYGVTGYDMLERQDFVISSDIYKLIKHIKNRNSEIVTCSGCLSGLVEKIYTKQK